MYVGRLEEKVKRRERGVQTRAICVEREHRGEKQFETNATDNKRGCAAAARGVGFK